MGTLLVLVAERLTTTPCCTGKGVTDLTLVYTGVGLLCVYTIHINVYGVSPQVFSVGLKYPFVS